MDERTWGPLLGVVALVVIVAPIAWVAINGRKWLVERAHRYLQEFFGRFGAISEQREGYVPIRFPIYVGALVTVQELTASAWVPRAKARTSIKFLDAEAAYKKLTPTSLGVKEIPAFNGHVSGQPIALNLRGVVGFGEVVLRLVCTLDLEFAQSAPAEAVFIKRWRDKHGPSPVLIASDPRNRLDRIRRLIRKLDLPTPNTSACFDAWLKAKGLIS